MDIHDTQKVVQFVEEVVDENIICQIDGELRSKPNYELESMLQQYGCSTPTVLARKMFNIYKDELGKG